MKRTSNYIRNEKCKTCIKFIYIFIDIHLLNKFPLKYISQDKYICVLSNFAKYYTQYCNAMTF